VSIGHHPFRFLSRRTAAYRLNLTQPGPSFPSVNALFTSLDQNNGELVAVSHETGAAEREDTLPSPPYGLPP
jgi:hypothetical protein